MPVITGAMVISIVVVVVVMGSHGRVRHTSFAAGVVIILGVVVGGQGRGRGVTKEEQTAELRATKLSLSPHPQTTQI